MNAYQRRTGDGPLLVVAGLCAGSAVTGWMLHRRTSRLSQWLDRLPGNAR